MTKTSPALIEVRHAARAAVGIDAHHAACFGQHLVFTLARADHRQHGLFAIAEHLVNVAYFNFVDGHF